MRSLVKPYLIQRYEIRKPYKPGFMVKDYLTQDYMGSAEFEFGSVGESYRRIAANISNLDIYDFRINGKQFWALVPGGQCQQYQVMLEDLVVGKEYLKEGLTFDKIIKGETPVEYKRKTAEGHKKEAAKVARLRRQGKPLPPVVYDRGDRFWLDIDNDIAFSFDEAAVRGFKEAVINSVNYMNEQKAQREAEASK